MSAPGAFSAPLSGLAPKTTYYYIAKAVGDGSVDGSQVSFTTSTVAPTVTTENATNVATTSATLNGNLTAVGTAASDNVYFEWGLTTSYGHTTTGQAKTAVGTFSENLTGLTAKTTYHYRAMAVGDGSAAPGADITFMTSTVGPTGTSDNATSIGTTSATLNGTLTSKGTADNVAVSFEWGGTTSYGNTSTAQVKTAGGTFSDNITGLTAKTTYHFRVKLVGDGPAVYGGDMTFTTGSLPDTTAPTITLVASSGITKAGATITWTTNEGATSQVQYGLTEDYGSSTTEVTTLATSHSVDLTGLKAGKTYHYRVVSKDAAANQAVSADNTFKTTSSSGGMPAWAWVIIAIALVGVLGAGAYLVRGRMAK
jgi:phosphodiesterase/alkaline phosphatase D-like protein